MTTNDKSVQLSVTKLQQKYIQWMLYEDQTRSIDCF